MSFFDKLGKTVTDTANSVVEKTKSSTDTIRLNNRISEEERNINAAFLSIGKKYVELHPNDAEAAYSEYLDTIVQSQQKIAEYQEQIRKNKHLLLCKNCGAEIPEAVLFCTKCGTENPVGKQMAEERAAREAAERAAMQQPSSPLLPLPVKSALTAASPRHRAQCSAPAAACAMSLHRLPHRLPHRLRCLYRFRQQLRLRKPLPPRQKPLPLLRKKPARPAATLFRRATSSASTAALPWKQLRLPQPKPRQNRFAPIAASPSRPAINSAPAAAQSSENPVSLRN